MSTFGTQRVDKESFFKTLLIQNKIKKIREKMYKRIISFLIENDLRVRVYKRKIFMGKPTLGRMQQRIFIVYTVRYRCRSSIYWAQKEMRGRFQLPMENPQPRFSLTAELFIGVQIRLIEPVVKILNATLSVIVDWCSLKPFVCCILYADIPVLLFQLVTRRSLFLHHKNVKIYLNYSKITYLSINELY